MQTARRFVAQFLDTFRAQGTLGKLVPGCGSGCLLVLVCFCVCGVPLAVILPSSTPTPQIAERSAEILIPTATWTIVAGDWVIAVMDVQRYESLTWDNKALRADGECWLAVFFDAKNTDVSEHTLRRNDFELVTALGSVEIDGDATGAAGDASGIPETVAGFSGVEIFADCWDEFIGRYRVRC